MIEHIIHSNILKHLEQYRILNDKQHDFRRGQSCETQFALSVNDLAKSSYKQSLDDVVIMGFSKAFDLVHHQRLPLKHRHFEITGKLHKWIQNLITMRTQQVAQEGVSSLSITETSGVPQGVA